MQLNNDDLRRPEKNVTLEIISSNIYAVTHAVLKTDKHDDRVEEKSIKKCFTLFIYYYFAVKIVYKIHILYTI